MKGLEDIFYFSFETSGRNAYLMSFVIYLKTDLLVEGRGLLYLHRVQIFGEVQILQVRLLVKQTEIRQSSAEQLLKRR
jgi:hypothetical protein